MWTRADFHQLIDPAAVGMIHLQPLPGSPGWQGDMEPVIQAALTDPEWLGFALEGYVFAALVYWAICFGLSRLSLAVERRGPGAAGLAVGGMR